MTEGVIYSFISMSLVEIWLHNSYLEGLSIVFIHRHMEICRHNSCLEGLSIANRMLLLPMLPFANSQQCLVVIFTFVSHRGADGFFPPTLNLELEERSWSPAGSEIHLLALRMLPYVLGL